MKPRSVAAPRQMAQPNDGRSVHAARLTLGVGGVTSGGPLLDLIPAPSRPQPRQMAHKTPTTDGDGFGARYGVGGCYIVASGVLFALVAAGGLVALFLMGPS